MISTEANAEILDALLIEAALEHVRARLAAPPIPILAAQVYDSIIAVLPWPVLRALTPITAMISTLVTTESAMGDVDTAMDYVRSRLGITLIPAQAERAYTQLVTMLPPTLRDALAPITALISQAPVTPF